MKTGAKHRQTIAQEPVGFEGGFGPKGLGNLARLQPGLE